MSLGSDLDSGVEEEGNPCPLGLEADHQEEEDLPLLLNRGGVDEISREDGGKNQRGIQGLRLPDTVLQLRTLALQLTAVAMETTPTTSLSLALEDLLLLLDLVQVAVEAMEENRDETSLVANDRTGTEMGMVAGMMVEEEAAAGIERIGAEEVAIDMGQVGDGETDMAIEGGIELGYWVMYSNHSCSLNQYPNCFKAI
jgi:hypothetical protein